MLLDGINLVEGSTATNLVLASGTTNPSNPNIGELFYRSDSQAIVVYNGSAWVEVAGGGGAGSVTSINATSTDITVSGGPVTSSGTLTLSLNNSGVSAGTYTKVTVDAKGRVTTATTLVAGDIPDLSGTYQPLDGDLTSIAGLSGSSGLLKKNSANTWSLDTNTYLTGNQSITISGDATGSGATSIALTLANSGVAAGTYTKLTVDAKGRVTTATTLVASDIPALSQYMLKSGDTITGTTTVTNLVLSGPADLKTFTESYFSVTGASSTAIDVSSGSTVLLSLDASINTLTFNNVPAAPKVSSLNMFITQAGGGSKTITWPNSVKWAGGTAPVLSTTATRVDVVTLVTYNSGSSWFGFISGQNYS